MKTGIIAQAFKITMSRRLHFHGKKYRKTSTAEAIRNDGPSNILQWNFKSV